MEIVRSFEATLHKMRPGRPVTLEVTAEVIKLFRGKRQSKSETITVVDLALHNTKDGAGSYR